MSASLPAALSEHAAVSTMSWVSCSVLHCPARYVSSDEKRKQGFKRENDLLIQRQKAAGQTVPYR